MVSADKAFRETFRAMVEVEKLHDEDDKVSIMRLECNI
jgi:hypothetical protein